MIITVVMLLLLGMLEFGFLFDHHLTLEYATREGARVGAALGQRRRARRVQHRPVSRTPPMSTSRSSRPSSASSRRQGRWSSGAGCQRSASTSRPSTGPSRAALRSTSGCRRSPGGGPTVDGRTLDYDVYVTQAGAPATATTLGRPRTRIGVSLKYDYHLRYPPDRRSWASSARPVPRHPDRRPDRHGPEPRKVTMMRPLHRQRPRSRGQIVVIFALSRHRVHRTVRDRHRRVLVLVAEPAHAARGGRGGARGRRQCYPADEDARDPRREGRGDEERLCPRTA